MIVFVKVEALILEIIMPNHLDVHQRPAVSHPRRMVRNYVDLYPGRLIVRTNHSAATVSFSFPVKNYGDLPARGPFSILVAVSYQLHRGEINTIPQSYTHEAVYTFSEDSEITGNSTFETPPLTAFLGYIDNSSVNRYVVEIFIDSALQVEEGSESNNRSRVDWFITKPASASRAFDVSKILPVPDITILSRHTKDGKEVEGDNIDKKLRRKKS